LLLFVCWMCTQRKPRPKPNPSTHSPSRLTTHANFAPHAIHPPTAAAASMSGHGPVADAAVVRSGASTRTTTTHSQPWRIPITNILLSTEDLDLHLDLTRQPWYPPHLIPSPLPASPRPLLPRFHSCYRSRRFSRFLCEAADLHARFSWTAGQRRPRPPGGGRPHDEWRRSELQLGVFDDAQGEEGDDLEETHA
jgi:hypothetical protein